MKEYPIAVNRGPFTIEPESRNVTIKHRYEQEGRNEMRVERADIPDLIKALQDAYQIGD